MPDTGRPPLHAFEVSIKIGGHTWEYVLRALDDVAQHIRQRGPECGTASGGWNGGYSVDIQTRNITPDAYRAELDAWLREQNNIA